MGLSATHILLLLLVIVLLFGRGRISDLMGDLGKGITSFREGLKDADADKKDASNAPIQDKTGETIDVSPNKNNETTQS